MFRWISRRQDTFSDPAAPYSLAIVATSGPVALVWGNCQAEPLATMLSEPLAAEGFRVVGVPPVYLITAPELEAVKRIVAEAALLVTQPVRPEYRMPGTGWEELVAIAPADVTVVSFPVAYDSTEFPFQIVGHGAAGEGIFAPLTSYHDIRLVVAAERGWELEKVLEWLPNAAEAEAIRAVSQRSLAEIRRREASLDVTVSEALGRPGAMFTINHPSNAVLTHMANGVLAALDMAHRLEVPGHEQLDNTTTALEPAVLDALGWPSRLAHGWRVGGEPLDWAQVVHRHLELLRSRPDIGVDARTRYAAQFELLGF